MSFHQSSFSGFAQGGIKGIILVHQAILKKFRINPLIIGIYWPWLKGPNTTTLHKDKKKKKWETCILLTETAPSAFGLVDQIV